MRGLTDQLSQRVYPAPNLWCLSGFSPSKIQGLLFLLFTVFLSGHHGVITYPVGVLFLLTFLWKYLFYNETLVKPSYI